MEGHWDAGRANPEACYFCHEEEGQPGVDYLGGHDHTAYRDHFWLDW